MIVYNSPCASSSWCLDRASIRASTLRRTATTGGVRGREGQRKHTRRRRRLTVGSSGRGLGTASKGGVLAAKAVETQGKGTVLATKALSWRRTAVKTQGTGTGNTRQRQCVGHEGSGNTRLRRGITGRAGRRVGLVPHIDVGAPRADCRHDDARPERKVRLHGAHIKAPRLVS